jgi:hypothetical protein
MSLCHCQKDVDPVNNGGKRALYASDRARVRRRGEARISSSTSIKSYSGVLFMHECGPVHSLGIAKKTSQDQNKRS